MVLGHKISDRLRLGTFHHKNLRHKTPESLKLSDKTPMTGFLVVWNQNPNHLGYQVKLANAQQQKNATLMREIVGISELGIGKTVIEAKSYVVELSMPFSIVKIHYFVPTLLLALQPLSKTLIQRLVITLR